MRSLSNATLGLQAKQSGEWSRVEVACRSVVATCQIPGRRLEVMRGETRQGGAAAPEVWRPQQSGKTCLEPIDNSFAPGAASLKRHSRHHSTHVTGILATATVPIHVHARSRTRSSSEMGLKKNPAMTSMQWLRSLNLWRQGSAVAPTRHGTKLLPSLQKLCQNCVRQLKWFPMNCSWLSTACSARIKQHFKTFVVRELNEEGM